ncbi:MAG: hypothetical protein U1E52_19275 [Geminicoccaceae bacterium]
MTRPTGLLVRCLIALYIASLATPLPAAAIAVAPRDGGLVLELCTGDGPRTVSLDGTTRPADDGGSGHRADHDCHACSLGCIGKGPLGGSGIIVAVPAPQAAQAALPSTHVPFLGDTACAPPPPRGPPTLS